MSKQTETTKRDLRKETYIRGYNNGLEEAAKIVEKAYPKRLLIAELIRIEKLIP